MKVTGLVWAGTRTAQFDSMLYLCRDVLGMTPAHLESDFAALDMPNGDRFEIFGPGSDFNTFMTHPVIGFQVDDIDAARAELEAHGIEFIEPIQRLKRGGAWCTFRGPDGFLYCLNYVPPRKQS